MYLFDEAKDGDPMLVLERFLPFLTADDYAAAVAWRRGFLPNRKSGGLALMAIGKIPVPRRYKFYFQKHYSSRPFRTDEMKRREKAPEGTVASAAVDDPTFSKKFPTVWEYLTKLHFDDGAPRQLSKVSIFVENAKIKVALNDNEERASVYLAADTVDGGLKALEAALSGGNAEWRAWNGQTKKK